MNYGLSTEISKDIYIYIEEVYMLKLHNILNLRALQRSLHDPLFQKFPKTSDRIKLLNIKVVYILLISSDVEQVIGYP